MKIREARRTQQMDLPSSTAAWNIGVDVQVWITIVAIVALAIFQPRSESMLLALSILTLNLAVALGITHKELLRVALRHEGELRLLRAALREASKTEQTTGATERPAAETEDLPVVYVEHLPAADSTSKSATASRRPPVQSA